MYKFTNQMMESLTTASQVIDALDGTTAVARRHRRSLQAVSNWRATGRIPSRLYPVMTQDLELRGKTARAAIWGIEEPVPSIASDSGPLPERAAS